MKALDTHSSPSRQTSNCRHTCRSFLLHSFLDSSLPDLAAAASPCELSQQPFSFPLTRAQSIAVHPSGSKAEGLQDQMSSAASPAGCSENSDPLGRMQARAADSGCSRNGIPGQMCQNSPQAFTSSEGAGHGAAMRSRSDRQFSVRSNSRSAVKRSSSPACCSDTGQSQLQAVPATGTQSDRRNGRSKRQPASRGAVDGASLLHVGVAAVQQSSAAAVGNIAKASPAAREGHKAANQKSLADARQIAGSVQAASNRQLISKGQGGKGPKGSSDRRKSMVKALARTTPTRAPTIPTNLARSGPSVQPLSTGITYSVLPATSSTSAAAVAMEPAQAVRVLQPLPGCTNQLARCCPVPELLSQNIRPQHAVGGKMAAAQAQPAEQAVCVPESVVPAPVVEIKAVKRSLLAHPEFC